MSFSRLLATMTISAALLLTAGPGQGLGPGQGTMMGPGQGLGPGQGTMGPG